MKYLYIVGKKKKRTQCNWLIIYSGLSLARDKFVNVHNAATRRDALTAPSFFESYAYNAAHFVGRASIV